MNLFVNYFISVLFRNLIALVYFLMWNFINEVTFSDLWWVSTNNDKELKNLQFLILLKRNSYNILQCQTSQSNVSHKLNLLSSVTRANSQSLFVLNSYLNSLITFGIPATSWEYEVYQFMKLEIRSSICTIFYYIYSFYTAKYCWLNVSLAWYNQTQFLLHHKCQPYRLVSQL